MKWYRSRTVKCKLHHRATHHVPKEAKKAAAPDQPARAICWVGARPTCRQRQYIEQEGHRRQKNGVKSCSDAAPAARDQDGR
eukprot:5852-Prymnesium_polylepis.1